MAAHVIKALTLETFPAWLALAEKHNGVWGGRYCSYFHGDTEEAVKDDYDRATFKQRLENEGVAHAALVFDGDDAIAWCEFGSPDELPHIYHASSTTPARPTPRRGASRASSSTATTAGPVWSTRLSRVRCS
jgi:hypothetical protein